MSRARNLAGFATAIYPVDNISVGFITCRDINVTGVATFQGINVQSVSYAEVAGVATVATNAQGLTGTPNITVGTINSSDIDAAVVTANAFIGDGSGLTGVGGGLGRPVNNTFNTVALTTTFNSTITLDDANAGVGSHFVTVTEPILELGPNGDITVGVDKILVIDPVQLAPWS